MMKQQSSRLKQASHNKISIPIRFDNVSCVMTAKKSAKKCAAFSVFVLLIKPIAFSAFSQIFLLFIIVVVALSLLVALPHKTILDGQRFT